MVEFHFKVLDSNPFNPSHNNAKISESGTIVSVSGNIEIALVNSHSPFGHGWLVSSVDFGNVVSLDAGDIVACDESANGTVKSYLKEVSSPPWSSKL